MTYIVLSDNFVGGPSGSTVADEDLANCNISALIEAGHIAAHNPTRAEKANSEKEQ